MTAPARWRRYYRPSGVAARRPQPTPARPVLTAEVRAMLAELDAAQKAALLTASRCGLVTSDIPHAVDELAAAGMVAHRPDELPGSAWLTELGATVREAMLS